MASLKALILTGYGINCENESRFAIEKSGGKADILHLNRLLENPKLLESYNMLMIPGGFSFGDDLGSGKVFGNKIRFRIGEQMRQFMKDGKLVLGVCNGFQILVKMGLLPEPDFEQRVSLIGNDSGHFEDRWVALKANPQSPCIFTRGIDRILLPVRHGEGKFIPRDAKILTELQTSGSIVLQYINERGDLAGYPYNPNGSVGNIAGICNRSGRIFGLMPHPEAFNIPENCPYWPSGAIKEASGLQIFKNVVEYVKKNEI